MSKIILYNQKARQALEKGMCALAKVVGLTLGPKGKNVILQSKSSLPKITDDGATIAKEINLVNQIENMGALLLKHVALKTNNLAGDGTTTATILAHAIVQEGIKNIDLGFNPVLLKRGIKKAVNFVTSKILEYSRPVETIDDIARVATIASGNNFHMGLIISKAVEKAGQDGVIFLEEGDSNETYLKVSDGMIIEKGFMSPQFLIHSDGMDICQDNPLILLTDRKIMFLQQELVSIFEQIAVSHRSLLIIAEDISKEVLAALITNRVRGILDVVAVRTPGFGDTKRQILEDLAILTGGQVLSESFGLNLSDISLDIMGSASRVVISKNVTKIIPENSCDNIRLRCRQISEQIDASTNAYQREKLQNRLFGLANRVVVIKVSAATESEMNYKKLRFEDAISATKAAIAEGIVPGGGAALLHLAKCLDSLIDLSLSLEEQIGIHIVSRALSVPFSAIVSNTGLNCGVVIEKVQKADFAVGYDANTNMILDMYDAGIVDPVKVTRLALQNASSIASTILTTECIISSHLTERGL